MWKVIVPILVMSGLLWGGWVSLTATGATPRELHDRDIKELRQEQTVQNDKMIDRLEKIWEKVK